MPQDLKEQKQNEPISGLLHLIGTGLAIAALSFLAYWSAQSGQARKIVTVIIFGISLILVYLASALYHLIPLKPRTKKIFRKIDHSMIYILIAGSYTPICLVALKGGWGWGLFGTIWGLAILGISLKLGGLEMPSWVSTAIYLIMGWLAIIAFIPIIDSVSLAGFYWLLAGGLFYSIGTIFYGLDSIMPKKKWFGMHETWHLFVMAGSFSHFWAVAKYILSITV